MTKLALDAQGHPIQSLRPGATEALTLTGAAQSATAVRAGVAAVRIAADAAINYNLDGTATGSSVYLPAGAVEVIRVNAADVISLIGTGNVYITEML